MSFNFIKSSNIEGETFYGQDNVYIEQITNDHEIKMVTAGFGIIIAGSGGANGNVLTSLGNGYCHWAAPAFLSLEAANKHIEILEKRLMALEHKAGIKTEPLIPFEALPEEEPFIKEPSMRKTSYKPEFSHPQKSGFIGTQGLNNDKYRHPNFNAPKVQLQKLAIQKPIETRTNNRNVRTFTPRRPTTNTTNTK